jgi:hypothetical protein
MRRRYQDCLVLALASAEGSTIPGVFTFLLSPTPLPPRSIGIILLAGNIRENIGAQSLKGKILSGKGLALVSFVKDRACKFQDFRTKR